MHRLSASYIASRVITSLIVIGVLSALRGR
jgi:hypothetical protein